MAVEKLGLEVAVEGFSIFMAKMGKMNSAIGGTGKQWTGLSGLASGATKVLGTLAKVGIGAVVAGATAAAAAVGGLAIGIAKLTLEAAPLEGIGMAFDVMAKRAGLSLDELRSASRGTISDFELMRIANVALTGAGDELGQQMGKDLPRLMEIAQAAAKATGQSAEYMFNSLVTGVKRTAPMLIDNTGLQLKLGEANATLARQLGKTVEDLTAEERQIAILNATLEAGQTMVDDFGSGSLTAAEEVANFRTAIQNTKDQIGLAFLPVLKELLVPLSELATQYGPQVIEWAKIASAWMGEKLPEAIAFVTQMFGALASWFTENWPRIQETVLAVWGVIQSVFLAIGDVLIGEVWPKLQEAFANITSVMDMWGIDWIDVLKAVFTAISTVVLGIIAVIVGLVNAIAAAAKNITQSWRKMSEGFKRIIEGVITMFVAWVEFFKALIAGDWARALEMGKAYFRGFGDIIVGILQMVTGWFDLTFGTIIEMVKAWVQGIIDFAMSLKERLVGGSIIPEMLMAIVEAFKEGFARVIESVKSFFQDMIDQFKERLRALVDTVVSFASDMYRAGETIMIGLRDGIIAKAKEAVQAVVDAIRNAIARAKEALGDFSPSRVFIEIGRNTMKGFAQGVAELTPMVQAQIQTAIMPPQARTGATGTTNVVNNYNYNLTTNATTRPGGLRLEFDTMAMATR